MDLGKRNMSWRASRSMLVLATVVELFVLSIPCSAPAVEGIARYASEIAPLLKQRCVACHGPGKREGGLNLALPSGMVRGGEQGRVVTPGNPVSSLLWLRIEADEMPPDNALSPAEKRLVKTWIADGAEGLPDEVSETPDGDEHWAFQRLRPSLVPAVKDATHVLTPLDRYVQARLEASGLGIGPTADPLTLIRRVSFDLTGLPPTLDDIALYAADGGADAYGAMVDRYLASEHYGERWGKFWLDAAGYADSNGYFHADTDRPLAFRYRDYVIRAINRDMPWDQFVREQLAGDELVDYRAGGVVEAGMVEPLEAVHFLRNSPDGTDSSDGNPEERLNDKYTVLEGTLQTIGAAFFGLTLQCARCHDHKFEPFSQREYYQLQAILFPAFDVQNWEPPGKRVISTANAEEIAAWREQVDELDTRIAEHGAIGELARIEWASSYGQRRVLLMSDRIDPRDQHERPLWTDLQLGSPSGMRFPPDVRLVASPGTVHMANGALQIVADKTRGEASRVIGTTGVFDWTPESPGDSIQASFTVRRAESREGPMGLLISLRDPQKAGLAPNEMAGGNILIEGRLNEQQHLTIDAGAISSRLAGQLGNQDEFARSCYGVRVTNIGDGKFQIARLVDRLPQPNQLTLTAADLPDGRFGFRCDDELLEVDDVVIESVAYVAPTAEITARRERDSFLATWREKEEQLVQQAADMRRTRPERPGKLAVVHDRSAEQTEVPMLVRGERTKPGELVAALPPRFLTDPKGDPAEFSALHNELPASTGRRLAFAKWLTQSGTPASALMARVTVNRWWQRHFGRGIVRTTDNLGYSSEPPTHPELLDYLARELEENGWSAKAIHRHILMSAVYRQSSQASDESMARDPDNVLLSRFPLLRLDAEAVRDGMLAASGQLDRRMYGPYIPSTTDQQGDVRVDEHIDGAMRRSVYLQQRRTQVNSMLEVFDAPSIVGSCTMRHVTTAPLQSLALMNADFVRRRAASLAQRLELASGGELAAFVRAAFSSVFGRPPSSEEAAMSQEFIQQLAISYSGSDQAHSKARTDFCHMLLASNLFLYVM